MKKRILSILLLCCMVLTLLPTTAFAAGKIWVGTEEELLAALADNTIDKITLTADITVSQTLVIDRQVVLVLDHRLKIDREQSGSGTLFHITKSGYLDTNAGSITDNVLNEGKFFPRQISGEVINEGEIIRGSFSGKVKNRGSINYGSFRGEVENAPGGKIANGELYGEVTNHGEISGREFYGKVTNDTDGLITSGEFYGEVVNNGIISYGKFYGDVVNNGTITGGSFFGTLTGSEIQDNAYIAVTFADGDSTVAVQRILRGQKAQRPAAPTKDGYTFIGWYNKADLQYINLPEWNFDYPVFENMELVAQWMEAMPISTDPVAYLDENGQTKYCTAYTVLTSETKKSILDYDDKWYDLPAGWYVVKGNVTITPRLDTHGAVNLILTNGSHLTAEWGIDVKVGDTFTVYAQSTDEGTMGGLTACLPVDFNLDRMTPYSVWPYYGMAGIGSSARWRAGNDGIRESEGTIIINGGTVKATAKGNGFGIGGARIYNTGAMTVTINEGTIEATANRNNAAIGDKGKGKSGVTINGGVIHAVGKGGAAGIGSKGDIRITGGELTVSAEGSGAAIGGFTDSYSERVDCKSITINGDVIQSISSKDGACIGAAAGGSVGSIAISNAELSSLSAEKILIGWDADSPGGKLTIQNSRVESTDIPTTHTDGIRVGSNSELVIEESEIRLPHFRSIRVGGNGSIAVRDSDLHTYGIFMDENAKSPNDAKTLKRLEITDSTVLTGDIIGARGEYASVDEVVIHGSSIRLNEEYTYNYCTIGGGTGGSFGSIDIQNSQIHIPSPGLNTAIGNGHQAYFNRESRIRIANSQVFVGGAKFGPAIGAAYGSSGGQINILIENSTVTAKGGNLRSGTDYIPGIGKNSSGRASEIGKIQILNSTVESFRLEEKDGTNYVYDDLHTKELPGIPAENISICGSTVNRKTIDHSPDEYGKCALCDKYDLGYCYEHGLLTLEGLTDCVSDGSEKKLTGLSHQTGENETKQLAENTDYTASYSNNVHPYTLTPDDAGFDSEKAPKVTLYGTGNYCGKAEHYFTISENAAAAPSITTSSLPDGKVGEAYSHTLTATGTAPITWSIDGGLPAGLSLNKDTGEISGTPTTAGTSTFTVKATNSAGSNTKELSITIEAADPVELDPVPYLDADGKRQVCTEYTVLTSETKESILDYDDKWYDLPAGWYVVEGNVTITPRLDTHGAVNLILKDGSHLTAEWGVNVKEGDTFTVYAQSTGEDTMGKLTACLSEDFNSDWSVKYYVWPSHDLSGIGAGARWRGHNDGFYENEGTIIINGGNIRAKGQDSASAIGGPNSRTVIPSQDILRQGGTIIINGGTVRTEALEKGNNVWAKSVGIGTCQFGYGGSVTINGGTVIAEAACDAITTGYGGTITINGGDVTAHGGIDNFEHQSLDMLSGNGIGPYWTGTVTINGGHVKAFADGESCGIGGHRGEVTVTITGGTVEAVAANQFAAIGGEGSVTITGGVINAAGKNNAAGIGSNGDIRITGGEITVSAEGLGAAIGGYAGVDCGNITIQGNVIKSVISSGAGACIGGASNRSAGSITISNAKLPPLNGTSLIGWIRGNTAGSLTIQNCYIESTDTAAGSGIQVSDNGNIRIENSEVKLPEKRDIRAGDGGSIVIHDSTIHSNGIYMLGNLNEAKTLKRLEITGSTVVTAGNVIGAMGSRASVDEIVIHGSSLSPAEGADHYYAIGGGESASFGSIDIQGSQINIPLASSGAAIGGGNYAAYSGESTIRIANSQVTAATGARLSAAIGTGNASQGTGSLKIFIESSNVTAKGGPLRQNTDYVPGIGKYDRITLQVHIQVMDSTVESFRHTKRDSDELVYDDLHEKNLPGVPAENISICGSTVNGKTIGHIFDEYGKCTLCGKYDLGYCYEHGLLTMEGLTDCVYDGSEKKLTGLSHQTGENETKQLAENTDYTASYSNNVHPYTLKPDDAGFDPEKAPKVTLYGTGNYCGKAEHYFTISENAAAAPSITTSSLPDGKVGEAYSQILTATGTTPIKWSISGGARPDGLTLDETTGEISGTPTADGTAKFTVKAENSVGSDTKELSITITKDAPAEFTISVKTDGNGTASASLAKAAANTEITLSATPNEGYHFHEWQIMSGGVTIKDDKFTMPDSNVEVKAIFEEDAPPAPTDPAKPNISVTGTYTYNGSVHTATVNGYDPTTMDISGNTATDAGDYTVSVTSKTGKWADDSTDAVTAEWSIGKATQEAPNGLIGVTPSTEGGSDGKISNVTDKMEYRMADESIYTACSGAEIENLSAGHYFVRYAEDHNHFASSDTVVTVGEGTPLADCTITFNAGGGSGSMDSVTVKAGTNYILPECGFTAPADQEFNAWEIGGTEYKVGDSYTVDRDTEIKALWENSVITPTTYTVTVNNDGNGTASANPSTAEALTEITLTATPNRGYHFKEWQVESPEELVITNDKFLMPNDNVEVKAIFEKNTPTDGGTGAGATTYPITVKSAKNGDVTASHKSAAKGTTVILTVDPDKGYVLDSLTVLDGKDKERKLTDKGDGKYSFIMPADKVTVEASFKEEFPDLPNSFSDLAPSDFCYDAVMWAVGRDITGGIGNYTFGPNLPCTRAQAVTFLWRAAGSPEPETRAMPFTDVPVGSYYYNAVLWAIENGITKGTSDTMFSPDATCSRAQIVTFLWRAGGSPATSGNSAFTDVAADAYYAAAVIWAEKNDITGGIGGGLFGSNNDCTRGQIVTFIYRSVK